MNKDVTHWAKTCLQCQKAKISRHIKNSPEKFAVPDERFQHVHIDIVGPLPITEGYRYCLTMVDRFTRWSEATPLKEITAEAVAAAFYSTWVARFGAPKIVTTDQGRQFEAELFKKFVKLLGCSRTRTSPYHPSSNGLIERWHRTLKAALMCQLQQDNNWPKALPVALLGLRTAYKEDIKCSTAELLYGTSLRVPGEFFEDADQSPVPEVFLQDLRERVRRIRAKPTAHHCKKTRLVHRELQHATHVFLRDDTVRKSLQHPYSGPFEILARINDRLCTILVNDRYIISRSRNISTERLKPAYLPQREVECSSLQSEVLSPQVLSCDKPTQRKKRVTFQEN